MSPSTYLIFNFWFDKSEIRNENQRTLIVRRAGLSMVETKIVPNTNTCNLSTRQILQNHRKYVFCPRQGFSIEIASCNFWMIGTYQCVYPLRLPYSSNWSVFIRWLCQQGMRCLRMILHCLMSYIISYFYRVVVCDIISLTSLTGHLGAKLCQEWSLL